MIGYGRIMAEYSTVRPFMWAGIAPGNTRSIRENHLGIYGPGLHTIFYLTCCNNYVTSDIVRNFDSKKPVCSKCLELQKYYNAVNPE
jgi:hypothetical protein